MRKIFVAVRVGGPPAPSQPIDPKEQNKESRRRARVWYHTVIVMTLRQTLIIPAASYTLPAAYCTE